MTLLLFFQDSIIYHTSPTDIYHPKLGDYLGCMTDELAEYGPGCFISEFVSAGPKQYSFRVKNPLTGKIVKTITKVKGFSLNFSTAAHVNFKRMRRQVRAYVQNNRETDEVVTYGNQIRRTKTHQIVTEPFRKVQKVVYCKRVVHSDFTTLPFGYE